MTKDLDQPEADAPFLTPDDAVETDLPTPRMLSWARNSASYRLARRMHTEKQLRDAISRKAREKFEAISDRQVEALAAFAVKFAYDHAALDDVSYAEIASRSGARTGRSKRAITQKLITKGIDREMAAAAVADLDDIYGAIVLARKRAFGPFRKVDLDEKRMGKELSAFARAGYGFDIGRRVFDMQREEAEDVLERGAGQ